MSETPRDTTGQGQDQGALGRRAKMTVAFGVTGERRDGSPPKLVRERSSRERLTARELAEEITREKERQRASAGRGNKAGRRVQWLVAQEGETREELARRAEKINEQKDRANARQRVRRAEQKLAEDPAALAAEEAIRALYDQRAAEAEAYEPERRRVWPYSWDNLGPWVDHSDRPELSDEGLLWRDDLNEMAIMTEAIQHAERYMHRTRTVYELEEVSEYGGAFERSASILLKVFRNFPQISRLGMDIEPETVEALQVRSYWPWWHPNAGEATTLYEIYSEFVPKFKQLGFRTIRDRLELDTGVSRDRPGGWWGWWAMKYPHFDEFATDMRRVCFNAMRFNFPGEEVYETALSIVTGGRREPSVTWSIDREFARLEYDEYLCGKGVNPDAEELHASTGFRPFIRRLRKEWYASELLADMARNPFVECLTAAQLLPPFYKDPRLEVVRRFIKEWTESGTTSREELYSAIQNGRDASGTPLVATVSRWEVVELVRFAERGFYPDLAYGYEQAVGGAANVMTFEDVLARHNRMHYCGLYALERLRSDLETVFACTYAYYDASPSSILSKRAWETRDRTTLTLYSAAKLRDMALVMERLYMGGWTATVGRSRTLSHLEMIERAFTPPADWDNFSEHELWRQKQVEESFYAIAAALDREAYTRVMYELARRHPGAVDELDAAAGTWEVDDKKLSVDDLQAALTQLDLGTLDMREAPDELATKSRRQQAVELIKTWGVPPVRGQTRSRQGAGLLPDLNEGVTQFLRRNRPEQYRPDFWKMVQDMVDYQRSLAPVTKRDSYGLIQMLTREAIEDETLRWLADDLDPMANTASDADQHIEAVLKSNTTTTEWRDEDGFDPTGKLWGSRIMPTGPWAPPGVRQVAEEGRAFDYHERAPPQATAPALRGPSPALREASPGKPVDEEEEDTAAQAEADRLFAGQQR